MKGRIQTAAGVAIGKVEAAPRVKSRVRDAKLVANHNKVSPVKKLVRGAKLATNHNKAALRLKARVRDAKIIANHNRALAR